MGFKKGNKLAKGGKRKGSGPKPSNTTIIRNFLQEHPDCEAEMLEVLYNKAIEGHVDSADKVLDRIKGKARQQIDQRNLNLTFTADDYVRLGGLKDGMKLLGLTPSEGEH